MNNDFASKLHEDVLMRVKEGYNDNPADVITADKLLNRRIENIPCLVEPILPKVGLIGLAGSSDTGKSSFLRQLAVSICVGDNDFLGFKLKAENKKAIYVSTEDDDYAISYLLNKSNNDRRLSPEKYSGLSFIFDTHNLLERLDALLTKQKTDLIVVDAFTDLYGKSMNDTNQVRSFLNQYSQLAQKHKCLIIFLHHTGKRTEDLVPSKHNLLGSQGFEAKMRLVIELRTDPVETDKRHLCIVKANYLPREYKTESFVLRFDEYLQFFMTNERRPFEELKTGNKTEIKEMVRNMKNEGKTQTEIAKALQISQATVSRYLKES